MIDLAEPRGDRPHDGPFDSRRKLDLAQTLVDLLASKIDVDVVAEDRHDLREAELGD